jgi:hypothetical protein
MQAVTTDQKMPANQILHLAASTLPPRIQAPRLNVLDQPARVVVFGIHSDSRRRMTGRYIALK